MLHPEGTMCFGSVRRIFGCFTSLAMLTAVLGGCSSGHITIDPSFGDAVREARAAQTAAVGEDAMTAPVEGLTGEAAAVEVKTYVKSFEGGDKQEAPPTLITVK